MSGPKRKRTVVTLAMKSDSIERMDRDESVKKNWDELVVGKTIFSSEYAHNRVILSFFDPTLCLVPGELFKRVSTETPISKILSGDITVEENSRKQIFLLQKRVLCS